jgi:TolA-binding protein
VADADSVRGEQTAAPLFASVAQQWPGFEHAPLALYRAGLGFAAGGRHEDAAMAWQTLLSEHAQSEYVRDSAIQIAHVHEKAGNSQRAADAYERFSSMYPADPDAPSALLKAVDLLASVEDEAGVERLRGVFIERFPGEVETVIEFREASAAKALADVTSGAATLSSLLAGTAASGAAGSGLKAYLDLAAKNPELASPQLLAQVDYLKAEEKYPLYAGMRLTQPLPKAIEVKKAKMEELLKMYDRCAQHLVAEYSRASAHRIGQVLIEFGDALTASERPQGLSNEDLLAYDEVLEEQSWQFFDRGTEVWSKLLRETADTEEDPGNWIARTRTALWPRLAQRFLYRPEVDYPLVAATPPAETSTD